MNTPSFDGLGKASVYAAESARLGFSHLGLTNHGNIDGNIKFQKACEEKEIKPIHGCELYIVKDFAIKEKGDKRYHITTFIQNQIGWENLLKMLTIANVDGFYQRPRIDSKTLLEHSEGLIFSSACSSSFIHAEWGLQLLKDLKFRDKIYLEIMPHEMEDQKKTNALALSLSRDFGISVVATNDCHYPTAVGAKSQEVLLAIQSKAKWKDPKRWKFDIDGLYLKSYDEMTLAFKKQNVVSDREVERALRRTLFIARECEDFRIEKLLVDLPKVSGYEDRDETELLYELVWQGFQERILNHKKRDRVLYRQRIREELGLICELGFQRYFLIVWELINWCKHNDIMVGPGRGSSGSSLAAYLLHITDVDPIEYKLLFSRFISPARIDLPDIDMDFEDIKRDQIRLHLEESYGKDNVVGVSTFSTLKGRAALRDVSRVFDISPIDVDAAAKAIVTRSGGDFRSNFTIEDAFDTFEDGIRFKKKYPEATKIAIDLEGQVRGSSQHAAAICISKDDLKLGKRCNLCVRNGTVVANWDKHDAEYMGMMKLDILGLSALTVLSQTRFMVKRNCGIDIIFNDIPMDDKAVYEEISKGHTVGAFQIGSMGLSSYCKELGVENFDMLVHATSLWRPGTLRSGLVSEFADRKKGKPYSTVHPKVGELTKDTYGIILYQEQVMLLMYELGGLGWKTCDTVRKVISKSQGEELFKKFKEMFVEGCKEKKTLDEESAGKVWEVLASFGCLTGDTVIYRASSNQFVDRELTIKQAYHYQSNSNFKYRGLKVLSMSSDGFVRYNRIKRIVKTGKKEVFYIRTVSSKSIKASGEHSFLVNGEWCKVNKIRTGDEITCSNLILPKKIYGVGIGSGVYRRISSKKRKGQGITNEKKKQKVKLMQKYNGSCQICRNKKQIEMHHLNENINDNSDGNTMLLCKLHHRQAHDSKVFSRFQVGYYAQKEKILEIKSIGERETYDIEMIGEPRNFIANNFVSHNSYGFCKSHAVEYSMITYWQTWCVDGSTKIWDCDKNIYTSVAKAFRDGIETTFCYDELTQETKKGKIKRIIKKVIRPDSEMIYTVRTRSAKKLRATKDHRVLTNKGYKRVFELAPGDLIAVEKRINFWERMSDTQRAKMARKLGKASKEEWGRKTAKEREKQYSGLRRYQSSADRMSSAAKKRWESYSVETRQRMVDSLILAGIASNNGYRKRFVGIASDGHKVFSKGELLVDNWLCFHGIQHDKEVPIGNKRADFKAMGIFIEFDGMNRPDFYFDEKFKDEPYIVIKNVSEIDDELSILLEPVRMEAGDRVIFEPITEITFWKTRDIVYDIEMEDEPRNFIANGVVVHNCKVHHPAEFMACLLTYGGDDKKAEYVDEARRLGLFVRLPKVGVSDSHRWETVAGKSELYVPFLEIKGIGEKTASDFQSSKELSDGFFKGRKLLIKTPGKKIQSLMKTIEDFNSDNASDGQLDQLQELFQFDVSNDPLRKIKDIYELMKNKITLVQDIDFSKPSKEYKLFFGKLPEIKYGYRQSVLKSAKDVSAVRHHMLGTAENLGGVYGFLKDMSDTANAMAVFNSSLYTRRKQDVEHCGDEWMLIEANYPRKATNNIFIEKMATENDIKNCNFDEIDVSLIKKVKQAKLEGLSECKLCELHKQCISPVESSIGQNNVMIIGEAPGRKEDKERKGFVGDAGDVLWKELRKNGLNRDFFYIANTTKCFPSEIKTPSKTHINVCTKKWLVNEIKDFKPILILALGNAPLQFLKNQEGGIIALNGTTEWNKNFKVWICWCIHPASVLYQEENSQIFKVGIDNFVRCLKNLGYKKKT